MLHARIEHISPRYQTGKHNIGLGLESKADRLREIVKSTANNVTEASLKTAEESIIAIFKECVPESDLKNNDFSKGWDWCRWVTLKNIEEMGK